MAVVVALILSAAWLGGAGYYLTYWVGIENLLQFAPNELGGLATGRSAPCICLVLCYCTYAAPGTEAATRRDASRHGCI